MKKFTDSYDDFYRESEIYDTRLPLLCNMIKYCHRDVDAYEHKLYDIEIDLERNTVKLMYNPLDSQERAWIELVGAIVRQDQMHEMQDTYDMTYFDFVRMTPVRARYHRDNSDLENPEHYHVEMLSDRELQSPELLELIDDLFDEAMYMKTVDKVTGRTEIIHEIKLSEQYHKLDEAD